MSVPVCGGRALGPKCKAGKRKGTGICVEVARHRELNVGGQTTETGKCRNGMGCCSRRERRERVVRAKD